MVHLYNYNLIQKENGKINFQCVDHEYRQFLMIGVISILSPVSVLHTNVTMIKAMMILIVFMVGSPLQKGAYALRKGSGTMQYQNWKRLTLGLMIIMIETKNSIMEVLMQGSHNFTT